MNAEATPATADLQNAISWLQAQLLADTFILGLLRTGQGLIGVRELRRRVGHAGIEPELVEVVTQIVVLLDIALAVEDRVRAQEVDDAIAQMKPSKARHAL